jgi:hypothetical protein
VKSETSELHISLPPNQTYYIEIGLGSWRGTFSFHVSSWPTFWKEPLGIKWRALALGLVATFTVLRNATITSLIYRPDDQIQKTVVGNHVRIRRLGLILYLLDELYTLDVDGRSVEVTAHERFGPVPFLFNNRKQHPAVIEERGMRATYYIPLLGTKWVGEYRVHLDLKHIDSTITCAWAEAHERISKVTST